MQIFQMSRVVALASLVALAVSATAQNRQEYYNYTHEDRSGPINSFTTTVGTNDWSATAGSFFYVSGDGYDSLPWHLLFAHLANNSWRDTKSFEHNFDSSVMVTNVQYYYVEGKSDTFVPGIASSSATRYLNDFIVTDISWVIGDYDDQNGNPPGEP